MGLSIFHKALTLMLDPLGVDLELCGMYLVVHKRHKIFLPVRLSPQMAHTLSSQSLILFDLPLHPPALLFTLKGAPKS